MYIVENIAGRVTDVSPIFGIPDRCALELLMTADGASLGATI